MSGVVIAFLFAAGVSAWVYAKMERKAGTGNAQTSIVVAGVVFVILFFVGWSITDLLSG